MMFNFTDPKFFLNGKEIDIATCDFGLTAFQTKAPNCRCVLLPQRRTEINDLGSKLAAQLLLCDGWSGIIISSHEEWIGINLLERDDELPPRRKSDQAKAAD